MTFSFQSNQQTDINYILIVDGPVFGCDLSSLCNREGQLVPKILQYCIDAIEVKGLQTDGLYRICGNLSEVQKIRFQVNHGKD